MKENQIVICQTADGHTEIEVKLEENTVWLRQSQITALFQRDRTVITRHINNVFKEGELEEKGNVQILHISGSDRPVKFYNLDVIISVGYRVKSQRGTQFRIWANRVLKDHLVQGYTLNEKRLRESEEKFQELQKAVALASKVSQLPHLSQDESTGMLKVLDMYAYALDILDQYDHQRLTISETDIR